MAYNFYSGMFGINNVNNSTNYFYNSLSELSSIRSGSYRRLLESYYSDNSSSTVNKLMKDTKVKDASLTGVKGNADSLADSAKELYTKSSKSVFAEGDRDKIDAAVKQFVSDYNSLVMSTNKSNTKSVTNLASNMEGDVKAYASSLTNVGITIGVDGRLNINDEKFSAASVDKLTDLFNGSQSLSFKVASKAMQISTSALTASGTSYNSRGTYDYYNYKNNFESYL